MKFLFNILVLFLSLQCVEGLAMARNPEVRSAPLPLLYGDFDLTLKKLKIHFIANENGRNGLLKCQFIIHSEEERNAFLFTDLGRSFYFSEPSFTINGNSIKSVPIDGEKIPSYMDIEVKPNDYNAKIDTTYYFIYPHKAEFYGYDKRGIYAPLQKGENIVEIEWKDFELGYMMNTFISNIWLRSDITPLKYWKKVENIEITVAHHQEKTEFIEANIGTPIFTNNELKWHLQEVPQDEIYITLRETPSWFAQILIHISPAGFAFIAFLALMIFHLRLILKPNTRRLHLWLGIVLVPVATYFVLAYSFAFIEWIIGRRVDSHLGIFIILTYPIVQILYLVIMLCVFYIRRKKIKQKGEE